MATAKIISSTAGKHRVHFEFPLDHIARFTQDVHSKHAEGSEEIKAQFDAYASDYVKGFIDRPVFIEFMSAVDAKWALVKKVKQPVVTEDTPEVDRDLVYFDCVVEFPVKGTVRLVRDVHCEDDALTLGRKLQELANKLEAQFIAESNLTKREDPPKDEKPVESLTL